MTDNGIWRVGVDVGGTNTDAVVLDGLLRVVATTKVATTPDVLSGVREALTTVLADRAVRRDLVQHAMVGTTYPTNALIERRGLRRVAVLRIGAPATLAIPPLSGWPGDAREEVLAAATIVRGGREMDGRPIAPLDTAAIRRFAADARRVADGFAVVSVFAPVVPEDELIARELILSEVGEVPVSVSHEIGTIGLVERENATVLNVALMPVAGEVVEGVADALRRQELDAQLYVAQNDGTLMSGEWARRFPVLMLGSGPASSIRGAAHLSGLDEAIVADVGGTSTDIGVLLGGHPRASSSPIEIGGIQANFRMPDLISVGLGGGTVIHTSRHGHELGPASVGAKLTEQALAFGGDVPTLSDAAVAAGRLTLGDPRRVTANPALAAGLATSDRRFSDAFARAMRSPNPSPLVVVGGAAHLAPPDVPGMSEIVCPRYFEVANAVGAAISLVGREVDEVIPAEGEQRRVRREGLMDRARQFAIDAGADPARVDIIDIQEHPLTYLTDPATRVLVKAAGPLPGASR